MDLQDLQRKIRNLEEGILNPDRYGGEALTFSQMNDMGMLSLQLSAVPRDFNNSNRTEDDLQAAIDSVASIENQANRILGLQSKVESSSEEDEPVFWWFFRAIIVLTMPVMIYTSLDRGFSYTFSGFFNNLLTPIELISDENYWGLAFSIIGTIGLALILLFIVGWLNESLRNDSWNDTDVKYDWVTYASYIIMFVVFFALPIKNGMGW